MPSDRTVDNVMFSIDYPFESTEDAVEFIRTAPEVAPGHGVALIVPVNSRVCRTAHRELRQI